MSGRITELTPPPSMANSSGEPSLRLEADTVRTCPSVSNASHEEEEPTHFLFWGLLPAQDDCLLKCSWILVLLAQMFFVVAAAQLLSGPDEEDEEGVEGKEEDDWGSNVKMFAIMFSTAVAVFTLMFVFRVWRKHARPRLPEEDDPEDDKNMVTDSLGTPTPLEVNATGIETQLTIPEVRDCWKYLCHHTAMEFAIVSMWSLVSMFRVILYATTHDRISPWVAMSVSYSFLFGAFGLCTYWYRPVQRYSQHLGRRELLDKRGLGLLMFHFGCAAIVSVSFSDIRHLTVDEPPWWWLPLHFLVVIVGVTLILVWVPRRAAYE